VKEGAVKIPGTTSLADGTGMCTGAPVHPAFFAIHLPPVNPPLLGPFFRDGPDRTSIDTDPALIAKVLKAEIHRFINGVRMLP
jgi:hypothetical protein